MEKPKTLQKMPEKCLLCGHKIEIQKDGYGFCNVCLCYYCTKEYRDQINEAFRKRELVPKTCILCEKPIARNINGILHDSLSGQGWRYDSENFPELCLHGETYYDHRTCRSQIEEPFSKKIRKEMDKEKFYRNDVSKRTKKKLEKELEDLSDEWRKITADIIRIAVLHRRGFSIREIASKLDLGKDKVHRIIKARELLKKTKKLSDEPN